MRPFGGLAEVARGLVERRLESAREGFRTVKPGVERDIDDAGVWREDEPLRGAP